ncbi:MAG TPA: putative Ig domain-containing protein [Cytophagales bacterium]|nr:putative Ig domain-containing protein [Cytophagales bacterium]
MFNKYILLFSLALLSSSSLSQELSKSIDYLGQTPPKEIPEIFAPNIVSLKGRFEMGSTFSPDGRQFAFGVAESPEIIYILFMKKEKGKWSLPSKDFILNNQNISLPAFSPDGKNFSYIREINKKEGNIWISELSEIGTSNEKILPEIINSKEREGGHSITYDGTLYFTSNRGGNNGDVFRSKQINGKYSTIEKLDFLNSPMDEESVYISPKEDYAIIQTGRRCENCWADLYISFHRNNDTWTEPSILDSAINTNHHEHRPLISPDSKYLFFNRMIIGSEPIESDLYWVSTKHIFKPFLNNALPDTIVGMNNNFKYNLPKNVFKDIDHDKLKYSAKLKGGKSLPEWLQFEPFDLSFKGIPTEEDSLLIEVSVSDEFMNTATDEFWLNVSENKLNID